MTNTRFSVIDANLNRACEGLRVIEEYCRFILSHSELSKRCAQLRHKISHSAPDQVDHLLSRDTHRDARAKETPSQRKDVIDILTANFKRVTEALRVLEEYSENKDYSSWRYDVYELEKEVLLTARKPQIKNGIYVISPDPDTLVDAAKKGASLLQLRSKEESKETILNKALEAKKRLSEFKTPFLINDFVDIAITVGADGLHIGQDDLPASHYRRMLGDHKLIGKTTHNLDQGLEAQSDGADYISIGPVWETPSKPGRDGIGFDYVKIAQEKIQIPYVVIGGITEDNISELLPYQPPLIGTIRHYDALMAHLSNEIGVSHH